MEFDQDLLADLAASIKEHCPNTIMQDKSGFIADHLAEHILKLQESKYEAFGHSDDTKALQSISKLLSDVEVQIKSLSETTLRKLDVKLPLPVSEQKNGLSQFGEVTELGDGRINVTIPPFPQPISNENKHVLQFYLDVVNTAKETLDGLLKSKPYQGKRISKKLNYKGVLAAKACKMIWRDELIYRAAAEGTSVKSPNKYVKDEYDDPMKDFMVEIFLVLGMEKEQVPATLNAMEKIGGEMELTTSIDIR